MKIKHSNLPEKLPLVQTIVWLIALDHWGASDVVRGVSYTIIAILWFSSIVNLLTDKHIDIFKEKE